MPITKTTENSILSLKAQIGTLANGKPRYKAHSYSNVDVAATDDDMYAVAQGLSGLFDADIAKITRQNVIELVEGI